MALQLLSFYLNLNLNTMENWIIYIIMAVSGIGALISGLLFVNRTGKVTMQVVCLVLFEVMLFLLGQHYGWGVADGRAIGLLSGFFLVALSCRLWPTEDFARYHKS